MIFIYLFFFSINIFIVGFCQKGAIAQEAMICGRVPMLMVRKGGVKDRGQTPAKFLMVLIKTFKN